MRFIVTSQEITPPTVETLDQYARKKFSKIERLISKTYKDIDPEIKIHARKDSYEFVISAEFHYLGHDFVVNTKDKDLRRAIDLASDHLKEMVKKGKEKVIERKRVKIK